MGKRKLNPKLKNFLQPKIGKRRIKLTRVVPAAALAINLLNGNIGDLAKKIGEKILSNKPSIVNAEYKDLNSVMSPELDNVFGTVYVANEEFSLYFDECDEIKIGGTINPNEYINVFNLTTKKDSLENDYLYCEIENKNTIGLIKKEDLAKTQKIGDKSVCFDSIYKLSDLSKNSKYMQSSIGKEGIKIGDNFSNGDIIFADKSDIQLDNENNYWMKIRNNEGIVGYIQIDDTLQEIQDGVLVEVSDLGKVSDTDTLNLKSDASNLITDVEVGSRLVVIGKGSKKDLSSAIYFDANGIAKWGEISNDLIQEVNLVNETDKLAPSKNEPVNDIAGMNVNISNWLSNYKNGAYGIDIYGMDPNVLSDLVHNSQNISYGILRLGATGYGHLNDGLSLASSSVVVNEYSRDLLMKQANVFESAGIPMFAYFYATDINPKEGYEIADLIEKSLDSVNLNVQPIVDCEVFEEGMEDRMYFINKPNYDSYVAQGGTPNIDFEYMKSLGELDIIAYVKNHPEVKDYINYCQDIKAQSIAATYSKLYQDGYIKGKNALLYSGNKTISKDSYIITIQGDEGPFERIVLFKFDDVKEYLTNPSSPYFIAEDFSLKVWYADYTGNKNFEMLGEDVAIAQVHGDILVYENNENDCYDINYACPEYVSEMLIAQKAAMQLNYNSDDLELG